MRAVSQDPLSAFATALDQELGDAEAEKVGGLAQERVVGGSDAHAEAGCPGGAHVSPHCPYFDQARHRSVPRLNAHPQELPPHRLQSAGVAMLVK